MLIPVGDVIPSRATPWVTLACIVAVSALFLAEGASGWVPFLANVVALWIFGDNVEARMGHGRFLGFVVGAAAVAALAPWWLGASPDEPVIVSSGAAAVASGVVAAVIAAYFVLYPNSQVLVLAWLITAVDAIEVPAFFFAGLWVLAQVFWPMSLFTDATASLISCAAGIAWGLITVRWLRRPIDWGRKSRPV